MLKISHDLEYTNMLAKTKSLEQGDVTLSGVAWPGRLAFVSRWRLPMPNFRLLWRQISWDRMHLEAETSVGNLTQYKSFIGDDKKMFFGATFSFKVCTCSQCNLTKHKLKSLTS